MVVAGELAPPSTVIFYTSATSSTMKTISAKLRDNLVEIDRNFILELGSLYLCLVTQLEIRKLQKMLAEEK